MVSAAAAAPGSAIVLHYRVWRTDFRVSVASPAIAEHLQHLCRQFGTSARPDAMEIDVVAGAGGWRIRQGDEPPVVRKTAEGAARHVEWRMVGIAARAERTLIHWHAAALVRGQHTVLIPGKSGAGKSTLAVALALQGFELLGEDVVFMDPRSGIIHPFPRAPRVREASSGPLRRVGLSSEASAWLGDRLPATVLPKWRSLPSRPLSHVLFVDWDEEGPTQIMPITHAEAAIELQAHSHTLRRLRADRWALLRRVLAPTECFRMVRGENLEEAARALRSLVDDGFATLVGVRDQAGSQSR